jgi:hypothetical protein
MTIRNKLLTGTAALLLGCGGDTASTTKTTTATVPPSKPVDPETTVQPKDKSSVKLPPADVPEPPPPKAVTDKEKKTAAEEPKAPPPVGSKAPPKNE